MRAHSRRNPLVTMMDGRQVREMRRRRWVVSRKSLFQVKARLTPADILHMVDTEVVEGMATAVVVMDTQATTPSAATSSRTNTATVAAIHMEAGEEGCTEVAA